jgi:Protein of unknown function (DUF3604)
VAVLAIPGEKLSAFQFPDLREKTGNLCFFAPPYPAGAGAIKPVGNTVDVATANYTNDIGATELMANWTDPDFDPAVPAVYYARVLQIPTPRWSTYDAKKLGVAVPEGLPTSIQERAWTSPIWYKPTS